MRWTVALMLALALMLLVGCGAKESVSEDQPVAVIEDSEQADQAVASVNTDLEELNDVFSDLGSEFEE